MKTEILSKTQRIATALICALGLGRAHAATYNVTTYGAVGNGTTNDRTAIQAAIDAAAATGTSTNPSVVLLTGGKVFLTGSIRLKSFVTLQIDAGSTLKGVAYSAAQYQNTYENIPDYRAFIGSTQLIYAARAQFVKITGGGTIDGDAQNDNGADKNKDNTPNSDKRPHLLKFFLVTNVVVENVTLKNSNFWTQPYVDCDSVIISRVKVINPNTPPRWGNNDGIDIVGSSKVWIKNCNIKTNDDAICIKPTGLSDVKGIYNRGSNGIHILDDTVETGYGHGVKIGTETENNVKNVYVNNLRVTRTVRSAIGIEQVDGGSIENVQITNTTILMTGTPIFIRLGARKRTLKGHTVCCVGSIKNITIDGLTANATDQTYGSSIVGVEDGGAHKIQDVTLKNMTITMMGGVTDNSLVNRATTTYDTPAIKAGYPEDKIFGNLNAYGLFARHVDGLSLSNITINAASADYRPAFMFDQVSNLYIDPTNVVKGEKSAGSTSNVAVWRGPVDAGKALAFTDKTGGMWQVTTGGTGAPGSVVSAEAELLAYVKTAAPTYAVETGANYSKGKQAKFNATAVGQYITFTFNVPVAKTYNIAASFTKANNRGQCQFYIDNTSKGSADMYNASAQYQQSVSLGSMTLAKGNHTLKLAVTGKNASSSGYYLNLDRLVLTP